MGSPYIWNTPTGQEHRVSFAQTPGGRAGGEGTGSGVGEGMRAERLPNFILSAGYTPQTRSSVDGGGSIGSNSLLGTTPQASQSRSDYGFNERLRTRRTDGNDAIAFELSTDGKGKSKGESFMPQRSLLDDDPSSLSMALSRADAQYDGATPTPSSGLRTPMRTGVGSTPRGAGLFDVEQSPASVASPRTAYGSTLPGSSGRSDGDLRGRWVTVFGFGQAMQSLVLREFRNHGDILRHVTGKGNWMHIQYRTVLQAQVALSKRVRLVGGDTMVGVMECAEDMTDENLATPENVNSFTPTPGGLLSPAQMSMQQARQSPSRTPASAIVASRTPKPRRSFWQTSFTEGW
mmetsp:Transcript_4514/g.13694  ORF Transcript_4514/g.13694 Transcript_4514/m.13694 type:complete len:347 (-) Transcript_4514:282-1322(-)